MSDLDRWIDEGMLTHEQLDDFNLYPGDADVTYAVLAHFTPIIACNVLERIAEQYTKTAQMTEGITRAANQEAARQMRATRADIEKDMAHD